MHRALLFVGVIAAHPWLRLVAALVLLGSGLSEVLQELDEDWSIGVHHGAVVYGLWAVLRALPETMEGLKTVAEVHESSER